MSATGRLPALPLPRTDPARGRRDRAGVGALSLIDAPGDTGSLVGVEIGRKIGPFLALIGAAAIAFGGSQTSAGPAPATRVR